MVLVTYSVYITIGLSPGLVEKVLHLNADTERERAREREREGGRERGREGGREGGRVCD